MRNFVAGGGAALVMLFGLTPAAVSAGSAHYINSAFTESCTEDTLTVTGKEAGLGDEEDVHVVLTATAVCINPGTRHPKAENKEGASAEGDFPVTNGKADFSLTASAELQPDCSPPMTIVWTDVVITDDANGLTKSLPDCFP